MGAISTIALRDLKSFFRSLTGPTVFFLFLLFIGIFFYGFIGKFMTMKQDAIQTGGGGATLEDLLQAIYANIHFILLFIIPAITMGTFAAEQKNHCDRLFKSAPVSSLQVVLGKYFACLGLMTMVLIASLIYPLFLAYYGNPDIGVIFGGFLGLFLLIASQLAFGVWVSSMTSNQLIAFIFTMSGLFLLLVLNFMVPDLTSANEAQEALKYIATTDHLHSFLKGTIQVKDLTYFLLFTIIFLFFSNVSLDSQRWR